MSVAITILVLYIMALIQKVYRSRNKKEVLYTVDDLRKMMDSIPQDQKFKELRNEIDSMLNEFQIGDELQQIINTYEFYGVYIPVEIYLNCNKFDGKSDIIKYLETARRNKAKELTQKVDFKSEPTLNKYYR